jgi:phage protein D
MIPPSPRAFIQIDAPNGVAFDWDSWVNKQLIKSVNVSLVKNETSQTEIVIFDPHFKIIDSLTTEKGVDVATVKVYLGFEADLGEPIFKGLLTDVKRGNDSTTLIVCDMGFKMKLEKKPGYHNKKSDVQILKALAMRNGLKFQGPKKPLKLEPHAAMTQDEQTDWEHAMERARDAGLEIWVRQDTFFADYPPKPTTPVLTLKNRVDFQLKYDFDFIYQTPEGKEKEIKVRGRGKGGKRLEGNNKVGTASVKRQTTPRQTPTERRKRKVRK